MIISDGGCHGTLPSYTKGLEQWEFCAGDHTIAEINGAFVYESSLLGFLAKACSNIIIFGDAKTEKDIKKHAGILVDVEGLCECIETLNETVKGELPAIQQHANIEVAANLGCHDEAGQFNHLDEGGCVQGWE